MVSDTMQGCQTPFLNMKHKSKCFGAENARIEQMRLSQSILSAFLAIALSASFLAADTPPVHLRIRLAGAREAPPTVDDILFMAARPANREWTLDIPEVGPVTNGQQGVRWYEPSWKRPTYLFEYSGLINVPAGADYTFYVRRPFFGPAYLLINGEPMVDFPNRGGDFFRRNGGRQWRRGGRWRQNNGPGRQDGARSPEQPPPSDSNWIEGETIHLEKGMVEFRAIGFCERRADFRIGWKTSAQSEPQLIPASLFARAEKLRFTDVGKPLVYRAADARLAGVPPFCFEEDAIRPEIHIRSNIEEVEVAVALHSRWRSIGSRNAGPDVLAITSTVSIVKGWGRVEMPECRVADCERLEWIVRDGKDELAHGIAKFIATSFDEVPVPDGVYGDALTCGGTNCVFVSRRFGVTTDTGSASVPDGDTVFLNGFAADETNLLGAALSNAFDGHSPRISRTVDVRKLVSEDDALFAPPDLVTIVRLLHEADCETVVLAPEIRDNVAGEDLGAFERRLAGVAGLLRWAKGCDLVLVTPPPEMAGGAADMRDYAFLIHRVADAYGLRVADIYTLSRTGTGGNVRQARSLKR